MKFKLDENLPIELTEDLRSLGHDADTVADEEFAALRTRQSWMPPALPIGSC